MAPSGTQWAPNAVTAAVDHWNRPISGGPQIKRQLQGPALITIRDQHPPEHPPALPALPALPPENILEYVRLLLSPPPAQQGDLRGAPTHQKLLGTE